MTFAGGPVSRPADANLGRLRARDPEAVAAMQRMFLSGVGVRDIAESFGLSVRTAYRYLSEGRGEPVTVLGWTALFVARSDGPVRVSPWRRP